MTDQGKLFLKRLQKEVRRKFHLKTSFKANNLFVRTLIWIKYRCVQMSISFLIMKISQNWPNLWTPHVLINHWKLIWERYIERKVFFSQPTLHTFFYYCKICLKCVCLSICLSVCLSFCPSEYQYLLCLWIDPESKHIFGFLTSWRTRENYL